MDGVHPDLVIGPSTEILAGNGQILTAGAVDCHVHLICPQLLDRGARRGGHHGDRRRNRARRGHQGDHGHPGRLAPGPDAGGAGPVAGQRPAARQGKHRLGRRRWPSSCAAGAGGFKLHEDWGVHPGRDRRLPARRGRGRRPGGDAHRHAERGRATSSPRWPRSRAGHPRVPHRGRGRRARAGHHHGGRYPNVLPSSTNPTRPHTVNTLDEHLDMLMVCHHLNPRCPRTWRSPSRRIRPTTMAAEDILHDLGAISMIGSDSQAMGRIGETIIRTWQTAHVMKARRGALPGDGAGRQQPAGPALRRQVHDLPGRGAWPGRRGRIGGAGKLADLVLWEPALLRGPAARGAEGRHDRVGAMGDANASIPTPQPVCPGRCGAPRPWWPPRPRWHFVSPAALEDELADRLAVRRAWSRWRTCAAAARPTCRSTTRCPDRGRPGHLHGPIDGEAVEPAPATELPMAQRYFLF